LASSAQGKLDNKIYVRVGYSHPSWEPVERFEGDWTGGYDKYGALFDVGTIFMLNGILAQDNMSLGLDINYLSVYWHRFKNSQADLDVHNLRASSKMGPSFSYNFDRKLAFDIYVKAEMAWATGTAYIYNEDIEEDDVFTNFFTLGIATGVNFRVSNLILGFEYNSVSPKLENEENKGEFLGNSDDNSEKSSLPAFNFSIGMCF
jgi:hypothetical protein